MIARILVCAIVRLLKEPSPSDGNGRKLEPVPSPRVTWREVKPGRRPAGAGFRRATAALLLALAACAPGDPAPAPPAGPVPVVFNASRSARPGDLVSLQGANFGDAPEVWLDVPGGSPVRLPAENSAGPCWVAARIPPDAKGALVVRVRSGTAASRPVALNRAQPLHLDALEIVSSGTFHLFGPNLFMPGSEPVVTVNGRPARLCKPWSGESALHV